MTENTNSETDTDAGAADETTGAPPTGESSTGEGEGTQGHDPIEEGAGVDNSKVGIEGEGDDTDGDGDEDGEGEGEGEGEE